MKKNQNKVRRAAANKAAQEALEVARANAAAEDLEERTEYEI